MIEILGHLLFYAGAGAFSLGIRKWLEKAKVDRVSDWIGRMVPAGWSRPVLVQVTTFVGIYALVIPAFVIFLLAGSLEGSNAPVAQSSVLEQLFFASVVTALFVGSGISWSVPRPYQLARFLMQWLPVLVVFAFVQGVNWGISVLVLTTLLVMFPALPDLSKNDHGAPLMLFGAGILIVGHLLRAA